MIRDEASHENFKIPRSAAFLYDRSRSDYIIKREMSHNKQEDDNKAMQREKRKVYREIRENTKKSFRLQMMEKR